MSFWRTYVHIVWTTKNRQFLISESLEPQLYAQIVNKAADLQCYVYAVNGMADHIHVVMAIPPKRGVAEVVKTLKGASSHFVNQVLRPVEYHFEWQRGYGCFSLGYTQLLRATDYVLAQKEHHALMTTNVWLERSADVDDGPSYDGADHKVSTTLREATVAYDVWGEIPF